MGLPGWPGCWCPVGAWLFSSGQLMNLAVLENNVLQVFVEISTKYHRDGFLISRQTVWPAVLLSRVFLIDDFTLHMTVYQSFVSTV